MQRAINHQTRHLLHHVGKIKFRDAVALEIRCRIQKIDGVRYAVFHRELDGVHLVAQCLVDDLRILHHARAQLCG